MKLLLCVLAISFQPLQAQPTAAEMLNRALLIGDLKTLENLLSNGLSPEQPDRFGRTPLGIALVSNLQGAAELLLAAHADPNAPLNNRSRKDTGDSPVTPLQFTAQMGNVRIAAMLISAGAEVNASGASGRTALHFAAGHLDMMRFLIEHGADVNARDAQGASPLDEAAWTGSLDTAAILLAHGAHLNAPDTQTGATPLNEAAYRGSAKVVQFLLQLQADPEIPDNRGYTPLDNAVRMGKEDAAIILLESKARPSPRLFENAVKKDESRVVEILIQNGVPANALNLAASAGSVRTVNLLLDHHADPNMSDPNGSTPLEDAALKGFDAIAAALLDHGAQVNQINSASGTTALYAAASFGHANTVRLLLDHGADPSVCGRSRNTPWETAIANGYTEAANQLAGLPHARGCIQ